MTRKQLICVAAGIALIGAIFVMRVVRSGATIERLAQLAPQLDSDDPQRQIDIAQQIIDLDRSRDDVRLVKAQAMVTLGRFAAARGELGMLIEQPEGPHYADALATCLDSYIAEANELIAVGGHRGVDLTADRIAPLHVRADETLTALAAKRGGDIALAVFEARLLDSKAALLQLRVDELRARYETVQAVDAIERRDFVGADVTTLAGQLDALDEQLRDQCQAVIDRTANQPEPYALMMRLHLRRGAFDQARAAASSLASCSSVSRRLAGRVAYSLMTLERNYAIEGIAQDVQTGRRLIGHSGLFGPVTLDFDLAATALSLRMDRPDQAQHLATALLDRYPGHPGATNLLAQAYLAQRQPREALALLVPMNDRVRTAQGRYVQGLAEMQNGDVSRGHELLRQALEMEPNHLPARMALAESLAETGHILGAERDVLQAVALSPTHSRVMALHIRLLLAQQDRTPLANRLVAALRGREVEWHDAALAVNMILDDVDTTRTVAKRRLETDRGDLLALIAVSWCDADPTQRAALAALTGAIVLDELDHDPLRWPDPPQCDVLRRREGAHAGDSALPLFAGYYIATPYDIAYEMMTIAMDRWPGAGQLPALYAVLLRCRGADNAPPLDREALRTQLTEHPWCEPELLLAMRQAIRDADHDQVHAWLDLARTASPGAALAAQGRYHLLTDQPAEAIHDATMLIRDESAGRLARSYGTDIGARAHVQKNTAPLGVGMIESLAIAAPHGKVALQLASVDVLIDSGRDSEASAALVSLMGDQDVAPRWLDRMLVRAAVIMGPKRLDAAIETLLHYRRDDPLLLVYRAWCRAREGDLDGARSVLRSAEAQHPQSPRIRMMSAALHIAGGDDEQARAIYRDLQSQSGRVGAAAQRELERMSRSASMGGSP